MATHNEKIIILDFGSQTTQLIARRIREQTVYSEIHPYTIELDRLREMKPSGIILSGGPASVYDEDAPISDVGIFDLGIPVLGICYGAQLMMQQLGGGWKRLKNGNSARRNSLSNIPPVSLPAWKPPPPGTRYG